MTNQSTSGLTRRGFIASTAAAAGALAIGSYGSAAKAADGTIKVGFISPRTGPLGGFGEGDGYILDLARKAVGRRLQGRRQDLSTSPSSTRTRSRTRPAPASSPRI